MQGLLAGHDADLFYATLERFRDALKLQPMPAAWANLPDVDHAHRRIIDLLIAMAGIEGQDLAAFLSETLSMATDSEPLIRLVHG